MRCCSNNYAFSSATNQALLTLFLDLKDGAKIVSLKPFVNPKGRKNRGYGIETILRQGQMHRFGSDCVSWMPGPSTSVLSVYVALILVVQVEASTGSRPSTARLCPNGLSRTHPDHFTFKKSQLFARLFALYGLSAHCRLFHWSASPRSASLASPIDQLPAPQ